MKKKLLFFTLALVMLLSACSAPANQTNPTSTVSSTAGQSSGIDFTTGNLNGINLAVMGDSAPMPGFDAQNKYAYMAMSSFQETDTVYFGSSVGVRTLYYYDKSTGISDIMCADPSCEHNSTLCGAWTGHPVSSFYYNGQRWWIARKEKGAEDERDYYLYCSDLSGLNQERIKRIDFENISLAYNPQQYAIHRGNLFFIGEEEIVDGTNAKVRYTLQASPLDGTEEFAVLFDHTLEIPASQYMHFSGTKVYYSLKTWQAAGNPLELTITSYDLATGNYETVYTESQITEYVSEPYVTEQGDVYTGGWNGKTAYLWKLSGNQRQVVASWPEAQYEPEVLEGITTNFHWIEDCWNVTVRDYAGQILYEGKMLPNGLPGVSSDPELSGLTVVGGDREKLILILEEQREATRQKHTVLLDIQNNMQTTVLWSITE